jgi:hypothetical protein
VRGHGGWYALVWLAGIGVTSSAWAQVGSLERLVMPGPVASAHAEVETTCAECHAPFARGEQNTLCLDCHEDVARDVEAMAGYHGKDPAAAGQECSACHTEHEGRDADILGLDTDTFDHDLSNFPLLGKHVEAMCVDCHAPEAESYHAAETQCNACHSDDDRHLGNLGESCADCHAETAWTDVRFDHEQTTDYPLTGRHGEIACVGCHVGEVYEQTPVTCVGCHAADDSHEGTNGTQCQECHNSTDWQDTSFDHFVRTRFALAGGHSGLTCDSCHEGNKLEQQTPTECVACHRDDDAHAGINGAVCSDCHRVTEWLDVTFDHGRDTQFALRGGHSELECADCHVEPVAVAVPSVVCFDCHAEDDPHASQLGRTCDACHSDAQTAWPEGVRFDHDLASFPLLGKHEPLVCTDCHATRAFHDAGGECVDCHAEDDVHERRLGSDCAACHNPNDWLAWVFDHDAQTDFELSGAHDGLSCHACHREPMGDAIVLDTSCVSCHRGDDVHQGEFGTECAQCHAPTSFRDLKELQ